MVQYVGLGLLMRKEPGSIPICAGFFSYYRLKYFINPATTPPLERLIYVPETRGTYSVKSTHILYIRLHNIIHCVTNMLISVLLTLLKRLFTIINKLQGTNKFLSYFMPFYFFYFYRLCINVVGFLEVCQYCSFSSIWSLWAVRPCESERAC